MLVTVFEDTPLYQPTFFFFFLYKPAIMFKGYGFISPFPSLYMDKLFSCLCLSVTVCVNCTYSSLFPCICTECLLKNCLLEFILFPILWERCAIKMLMMKISVPLWESFSVSEFNGQLVDMTPCFWLVYKTLQSGFLSNHKPLSHWRSSSFTFHHILILWFLLSFPTNTT